jgi:hypothetical protein
MVLNAYCPMLMRPAGFWRLVGENTIAVNLRDSTSRGSSKNESLRFLPTALYGLNSIFLPNLHPSTDGLHQFVYQFRNSVHISPVGTKYL